MTGTGQKNIRKCVGYHIVAVDTDSMLRIMWKHLFRRQVLRNKLAPLP
jgi:hypothetical protein